MLVASQLSRNKFLVIVVKIYTQADFKVSGIVQFCLIFLLTSKYFAQDGRCLLFLGIHCNMSDSIKTGIISVASKIGDYIKKHLKISHQKI